MSKKAVQFNDTGDYTDTVAHIDPVTGYPTLAGSHAYGYDTANNLITDTWSVDGKIFVKTYTWTNGNLTGVSQWVKQ